MTGVKQRLALFLDGTWDTEDDSTNVQHMHALTLEGVVADSSEDVVVQKRYYDPGVGTGVLDHITGGGFGLGIETNVRQAYEWLVDHYCDGDEIYLFGFSRGAYTARSLVGFIATCGLVVRGAPLTVRELWDGYGQICRQRAYCHNWWERLAGKREIPFRRITDLKWDSGERRGEPRNDAEWLLLECSRRVHIRYLGIFDTVGALGLDALAIPGLRGRLAHHHNIYPTKLLRHCRHALAIDENRDSFKATPFWDYVPNDAAPSKTNDYKNIISQRWFVGAHSNIGGGYADNFLSRRPLEWILEGARRAESTSSDSDQQAGLATRELPPLPRNAKAADKQDSYCKFVRPIWVHFVRAKRNYRQINPPDLVRAGEEVHSTSSEGGKLEQGHNTGYSLRAIEEDIDESVLELAASDTSYAPANVIAYARRCGVNRISEIFKNRQPSPEWPGVTCGQLPSYGGPAMLVIWCTLAAVGVGALAQFFTGRYPVLGYYNREAIEVLVVAIFIAMSFLVIDWGEYRVNQRAALKPDAAAPRVGRRVLFWLRFTGMLLFLIGAVTFVVYCWTVGWNARSLKEDFETIKYTAKNWTLVPVAVAVLMAALSKWNKVEVLKTLGGGAVGSLIVLFAVWAGVAGLAAAVRHITTLDGTINLQGSALSLSDSLAVKLLAVQFAVLALWGGFKWVSIPMGRTGANLGRIVPLQFACTPDKVKNCLDGWTRLLLRNWDDKSNREHLAWLRVKEAVGEALYRDFGFILLYAIALGFTMWIGPTICEYRLGTWLGTPILRHVPLWSVLIVTTALADYVEDFVHFHYLRNHESGKPSWLFVLLGRAATCGKFLGFFASSLISLIVLGTLYYRVVAAAAGGWRWSIAVGVTYVTAVVILLAGVIYVQSSCKRRS